MMKKLIAAVVIVVLAVWAVWISVDRMGDSVAADEGTRCDECEASAARLTELETRTVVALSTPHEKEAVLRMLAAADSDATAAFLVSMLQAADPASALETFRMASTFNQPVRLQAANHIGNFRTDECLEFIEEWSSWETDEPVLRALGRVRATASRIPRWSPLQATGPPNADPNRDDPNAWASKSADMGGQWLELSYEQPMQVHALRSFEVNVPGAVIQDHRHRTRGATAHGVVWS